MLKLYRRRYIPDEIVELKDDEILRLDDEMLITRWNALKPRKDFAHGKSVLYFDKGWKVSRFYDIRGKCLYTYCDIVDIVRDKADNSILINDLLVDVIVYENGFVKVADTGEMADALACGIISRDIAINALRKLDGLLTEIYEGRLPNLLEPLSI